MPLRRNWWVRPLGVAAILATAVVLAAGTLELASVRSPESGPGWELQRQTVGGVAPAGTITAEAAEGGLLVRYVVESGSGGDTECPLPWIAGSERSDSALVMHMRWEQRGCADVGPVEFMLLVKDIPDGGLDLQFPISPEVPCSGGHVSSGGEARSCSDVGESLTANSEGQLSVYLFRVEDVHDLADPLAADLDKALVEVHDTDIRVAHWEDQFFELDPELAEGLWRATRDPSRFVLAVDGEALVHGLALWDLSAQGTGGQQLRAGASGFWLGNGEWPQANALSALGLGDDTVERIRRAFAESGRLH